MSFERTGLKIEHVGGLVVITIGEAALCTAVASTLEDNFSEPRFTDQAEFVGAVVAELGREEEDGTTLVHRMLDMAAIRAAEEGAEGIEFEHEEG